jgi:HEAT repeat protein
LGDPPANRPKMRRGLQNTERVLAETRNHAVLPLLAAALRSGAAEIRAAAIRATLRRRDIESHNQLIRLVERLDDADRQVLRDAYRTMPHHAAPALKAAIAKGDAALCNHACQYVELCSAREMFATLVKAIEQPRKHGGAQIAATVAHLANELHHELVERAQGDHSGPDPTFARHQLLSCLEKSISHSTTTPPRELVDAFLLLAPNENETLLRVMRDVHHPCHDAIATTLASCVSQEILERLLGFLKDTGSPLAVVEAIGRRTDRAFVDFVLHELKPPSPLRVLHNMKQLRTVAWLEKGRDVLLEFDGRAQAVAVELAVASGIDREALFELLKLLVRDGLSEGRRASCQALAQFDSPAATELVMAALHDPDPAVHAAALRQLRRRRVPQALQLLVARLESPNQEIRDAARSSLAEFNFVRYRAMFDLLDDEAVRTTGALVRQVDQSAREKLAEELTSPSVSTRLRGIEMALAMDAVLDVCEQLIELARNENVAVRKEAVAALAKADGPGVVEVLYAAARDSNRSVAEAAQRSLAEHKVAGTTPNESVTIAGGGQ